jgi:hypothetical protein
MTKLEYTKRKWVSQGRRVQTLALNLIWSTNLILPNQEACLVSRSLRSNFRPIGSVECNPSSSIIFLPKMLTIWWTGTFLRTVNRTSSLPLTPVSLPMSRSIRYIRNLSILRQLHLRRRTQMFGTLPHLRTIGRLQAWVLPNNSRIISGMPKRS